MGLVSVIVSCIICFVHLKKIKKCISQKFYVQNKKKVVRKWHSISEVQEADESLLFVCSKGDMKKHENINQVYLTSFFDQILIYYQSVS